MPARKTLDTLATVAFIVACVVLSAVAVTRQMQFRTVPAASSGIGKDLSLPELVRDSAVGSKTVVIAVSSTCRFCTASMPFYSELLEKALASRGTVHIVFVSTEPAERVEQYLKSHNLPYNRAVLSVPHNLPVSGTPALFVLDTSGTVVESWRGQLQSYQEEEVFKLLS
jgi:hypothetical protein